LHFHAPIAERCGTQHDAIRDLLKNEHQQFHCEFDNVSILQ
jgi:hypothetical protein